MQALAIRFIDKVPIEEAWVMYRVGNPVGSTAFRLQGPVQL